MTLSPGTCIGPYEVTAPLGEGGMGQVYQATDKNLGRQVAIKVLPDAFAHDPERLARFEREAKTLASLNHPNIAQIYGLEKADGIRALIMELVEGPTLAGRIAQGPISVDEALPIAKQICEALEAAHERGIIHRDLKPANIKVRPDGTVKVLDFGLAKALEPASVAGMDATASPTITSPAMMTGVGMLLGTAAYMSPEQARGKAVDKRTDIWAFGCVLYEMLTGQRAFGGEDVSETLAKVIEREPRWDTLPARTPAATRKLLARCLEKNLRRRLRDMGDGLVELEEASQPESIAPPLTVRHESQPVWRRAVVPAAALLLGSVLTSAAVWVMARPAPPRVVRSEITTEGETALSIQTTGHNVAITPDGSRIVYRGDNRLLVRALDRLEPDVLTGLGPAAIPFVSPDGQWVGFADGTPTLKKVAVTGGPAVTIAKTDGVLRGATWLPDDTVIFATGATTTGLQRVSAAGGEPTVLTKPDRERGEADHLRPETLPGGQAVLFTITPVKGGLDNAQIAVLDLATGTYTVVVRGGIHAHYVPTGHLVYGVGDTLRAVAFDLDRREIVGNAVPVLEGVVATSQAAVNVAVAANGTMVYVPGRLMSNELSLVWVDRMGREEPIDAPPRTYAYARLSPDGTRIALDVREQENDIWIWDLARKTMTRLTFDPGFNRAPVWSPDGTRVAFSAAPDGRETIYWQAADGTGASERLTEGPAAQIPTSFSPDAKRLFFIQPDAAPFDIGAVNVEGERRADLILRTPHSEDNGEISADGRWLAYQSNESGRDEIYVRPFPDINAGRWQVSTGGGTRPSWARNGRELFYFVEPGTVMAVPVQSAPSFLAGTPQVVVKGAYRSLVSGRHYDVSPDGRRFLMLKNPQASDGAAPLRSLVVVQNWTEELKRLVPTN